MLYLKRNPPEREDFEDWLDYELAVIDWFDSLQILTGENRPATLDESMEALSTDEHSDPE